MSPSNFRWGVSYYGNRYLAHAQRDFEIIAQAGCGFIVHTLSETDLAHHRKAMADIVQASHAVGLEVWLDPWGVGGVFGGESPSLFLLEHPEAWEVLSDGSRAPKACLNQPAFRQYMRQWVESAAAMNADGIFFDEPHTFVFQGSDPRWGCWCEVCRAQAAQWRLAHDGVPYAFLRRTIADFVRTISQQAAQRSLRCSLCVYPMEHPEVLPLWESLAEIPEISIVGTDPYWRTHHQEVEPFVRRWAAWTVAWAARHRKTPQLWIPTFGIPAGAEGDVAQAVTIAREAGVQNIAVWSFDCGALIDRLRSANPRVVWETLCGTIKSSRGVAQLG